MLAVGWIRSFAFAALFATTALLPACATYDIGTRTSAEAPLNVAPTLVAFASDEGVARLARASAKADFASLANQFEAQYNGLFCGPTSAAIVLNAVHSRSADLPRDHSRLRKEDLQFLTAGADPIVPRHTQDSVIEKGRKTRTQVLGEPITIGGNATRDFGYQLRQFDEMLRGHDLVTRMTVVDAGTSDEAIRADIAGALQRPGTYVIVNYRREAVGQRGGDYVIVNYRREDVGQKGGGHISPLGAYDAESDSFLVLDVNPVVAGWVWMPTRLLVNGMRTFDTVENRGYVVVEPH